MSGTNLNRLRLTTTHFYDKNSDNPVNVPNPWKPAITVENVSKISAFVDNIEEHLITIIKKYGNKCIMVGCVAWLSNARIIEAIAENTSGCLFLVNDENYGVWGDGRCIQKYERLPKIQKSLKQLFSHLNTPLNTFDQKSFMPVRCINNSGDALMHSKFLVFFKKQQFFDDDTDQLVTREVPYAVWTGSMNFTVKSQRNQENGLFFESEALAEFFFNDFASSFIVSKPLRVTGGTSFDNNANNDTNGSVGRRIPVTPQEPKKKRKFNDINDTKADNVTISTQRKRQRKSSYFTSFAYGSKKVLVKKKN